MHTTWKTLVRIGLSAILLAALLSQLGVRSLAVRLHNLTPAFVLFAWGYYAACQLLSSFRWQVLVRAAHGHVPLRSLFGFYLIGMFLNNFLPTGMGGDVVKTYYLYRETGAGRMAAASVFLERFTGIVGASLLSLLALAVGLAYGEPPLLGAAVAGAALFVLGVAAALWHVPPWAVRAATGWRLVSAFVAGKIEGLYETVACFRNHGPALAAATAISMLISALYAVYYALVAAALGAPINARYFMEFLPLVGLVILLPVSVGGLGVREALMAYLFAQVGVAPSHVVATSLTAYLLNTLLSSCGGLLLMAKPSLARRRGGPVAAEAAESMKSVAVGP
jgi:uncharacterized membrane protein YbhN (UPF0104 family)